LCLPPPTDCVLFIGIDIGDPVYDSESWDWSAAFPSHEFEVERFAKSSPAPIWPIACKLARRALNFSRCDLFDLLGDDVTLAPAGDWLPSVRPQFTLILLLLLLDFGVLCWV
jgi:hypothetical protein